ncbi:hypothetical protein GCM10010411_22290 [Actinomadura fulvescens]|uniref:Uncharacterized protein n=1 Tax=Actinomadura fulvescens TaxID=46160 RepID=A0ABP6C0E2_9ACTN
MLRDKPSAAAAASRLTGAGCRTTWSYNLRRVGSSRAATADTREVSDSSISKNHFY